MKRKVVIGTLAAVIVAGICSLVQAGGECCEKAMKSNGWCDTCKHGFFAGVEFKNKKLHDALDGKAIDKDKVTCEGCKKALASGGVCDKCHAGVIKGKAYTMVAYSLLIGEPAPAEKDCKCDGCKKNLKSGGWCDACKCGIVGNMMFKDKAKYEDGKKAYEIVQNAVKAKCDGCALAMLTDGTCEQCKTKYSHGKVEKEGAPAE